LTEALRELDAFEKGAGKINGIGDGLVNFGQKLDDIGSVLIDKVTKPIINLAREAIATGAEFESVMANIAAVTGAPAHEMEFLKTTAREMSKEFGVSSSEIGDALKFIAEAGGDPADMLDNLRGVMLLASASGENLGLVAETTADSIKAFRMEADQSEHFANVMAAAISASNTTMGQLSDTMKYASGPAAQLNFDIKDVAVATAIMANSGIKGSQAGTTLRSAFLSLAAPSKDARGYMDDYGISIYDAHGNVKPLIDIMEELRYGLGDLSEAEQAVAMKAIFGQNAISGMMAVVNASIDDFEDMVAVIYGADEAFDGLGQAAGMTNIQLDTFSGRNRILKASMQDLAIQAFELLLPYLEKGIVFIQGLVDKFDSLDDKGKKTVLVITGIVAAAGPVLSVVGGLVSGIGMLSSGIGMMGGALAVLTGPVGLIIAGVAALTVSGIALYKHMKQELIPEIEHFGKGVSQATQEATQGFLDMNLAVTQELTALAITGNEVTDEMRQTIVGNISGMAGETGLANEDSRRASLDSLTALFADSQNLTEQEKQDIIDKTNAAYDGKREIIEKAETEIRSIMEAASHEKRTLTEDELEIITANRELIAKEGIRHLTESEAEQKVILERMKNNASIISATQAAEVVKNAKDQKEKVIAEAESQYDKTLREIIKQRDEVGSVSKEQADLLIQDAQRQRDETVKRAEDTHKKIVETAKKQAGEHVDLINWETGEILTRWDRFKNNVGNTWDNIKDSASRTWDNLKTNTSNSWNSMKDSIGGIIDGMKTSISSKFNDVKNSVSGILDGMASEFLALPGKALEWGRNMIDGFVDGIKGVGNKIADAASWVTGTVGGWLGFNSPAKKGEGRNIVKWGRNMIAGFLDGVYDALPEVDAAMSRIIPDLDAAIGKINFAGSHNVKIGAGQGYAAELGAAPAERDTTVIINTEGLFKGAILTVREDADIEKIVKLAVERLSDFFIEELRGIGLQQI